MSNFLSITPSRTKFQARKETEFYTLVSLKTPPLAGAAQRPSLSIAVSLDVSPSMDETVNVTENASIGLERYARGSNFYSKPNGMLSKLDVALFATKRLIENMTANDYMSLTTFAESAWIVRGMTKMDDAGKALLLSDLKTIRSYNSTDVSAGLYKALDSVDRGRIHKDTTRVLLLTDGQTMTGHMTPAAISAHLRSSYSALESVGITTFGFGNTYNTELLASITRGGGAHYYIDSAEKIPTAFGTEFGTMTSLYAKDVVIDFDLSNKVELIEVVNDLRSDTAAQTKKIFVPSLLADQKFHVVLKMKTKSGTRELKNPVDLMSASVRFTDITTGGMMTIPSMSAQISIGKAADADKEDSKEVMSIVAEQLTAKAQREATAAAEKGDFKAASATMDWMAEANEKLGRPDLARYSKGMSSNMSTKGLFESTGRKMSSSTRGAFATQTASGQGGSRVGDVDLSNLYANIAQKKAAQTFAITVDKNSDDMPDLDSMLTP